MLKIKEDKQVIDLLAAGTSVGGFITDYLPTIVLALTGIWTLLRIYETETVQRLLGRTKDEKETDGEGREIP
jgi:hypothetical protein